MFGHLLISLYNYFMTKNKIKNDVRNNWALLAGVSVVSFGGALTYLLFGEISPAVGIYFVIASLSLAGFAWWWFLDHRPAMHGKAWQYILVVTGLEFGAFFAGGIEETRAIGAWLAVGIAFIFYGLLEKSRLISMSGLAAAILAGGVYLIDLPLMGFWLETLTGILFAVAAYKLKSSSRKTN
jgi:hypothetical protein